MTEADRALAMVEQYGEMVKEYGRMATQALTLFTQKRPPPPPSSSGSQLIPASSATPRNGKSRNKASGRNRRASTFAPVIDRKEPIEDDRLYSMDESAAILGIKKGSVYTYVQTQKMVAEKDPLTKHTMIRGRTLRAWKNVQRSTHTSNDGGGTEFGSDETGQTGT